MNKLATSGIAIALAGMMIGCAPRYADVPAPTRFEHSKQDKLQAAEHWRKIAEHFADVRLPYPAPQTVDAPAQVLARGHALVMQGDAQRQIPACVACHGAAMTGELPATPGLLGLPRDYLLGQLGAWQNGKRRANAPDCMAQVAQRLSVADVSALATWLSAQPLPANTQAVAPGSTPRPLDCGHALPPKR